jgi:hypothetical protein
MRETKILMQKQEESKQKKEGARKEPSIGPHEQRL